MRVGADDIEPKQIRSYVRQFTPSTVNPVDWVYAWDETPLAREQCRICRKWACSSRQKEHIYMGICKKDAEKLK